jgi:hypothetical protein
MFYHKFNIKIFLNKKTVVLVITVVLVKNHHKIYIEDLIDY